MALKDIEKLKERVEKDPNSKLFVPLAEEYRKEGMLDEAISVLVEGLDRQPGYMSARVSLGKIYLEKGLKKEARLEFENVIKVIPDNLYAHKKLAEIYREEGNRNLAIKSYRNVLKLNAMDEEAINSLREIEEGKFSGGDTGENETGLSEEKPKSAPEPVMAEEMPAEPVQDKVADVGDKAVAPGPASHGEEFDSFRDSFLGETAEKEDDISDFAIAEKLDLDEPSVDKSFPEETEPEVVELKETSFGDLEGSEETVEIEDTLPATVEVAQPEAAPEAPAEEFFDLGPDEPETGGPTFEDAEKKISQEDYIGAMSVYRKMLSASPNDKKVLQRVDDLRTLLKIMGRDKDTLILKLNVFLDGINKRRDEFFRNP